MRIGEGALQKFPFVIPVSILTSHPGLNPHPSSRPSAARAGIAIHTCGFRRRTPLTIPALALARSAGMTEQGFKSRMRPNLSPLVPAQAGTQTEITSLPEAGFRLRLCPG